MTRSPSSELKKEGFRAGKDLRLLVKRKPLPRQLKLVFFSLGLIGAATVLSLEFKSHLSSLFIRKGGSPSSPLIPAKPVEPRLIEQRVVIHPGKTITELLSPFFPSLTAVHDLLATARPFYDLSRIKSGHQLWIRTLENKEFVSLQYEIDRTHYLHIKKEQGRFSSSIEEIPYEVQIAFLAGVIEDNPIEAFNRLGEGDSLALAFAELFSWDIDFYTDLRSGDTFSLVFEKKFLRNEFADYGAILAAEIVNQGKKYQAFRFTYPDTGKTDYFDAEGKSRRKEFLRSPIKYGRITSRFSFNRLHPIRKILRPHFGVDYAAPVGTPVQATGDGVITFAGWNGGAGRMITIRHQNGYETLYLHLRSFAPEIKVGARVAAGEVIGYVGSSGESTGPHLDYRIRYRGRYINPFAWRFQPAEPLRPGFEETFKNEMLRLKNLLSFPLFFSQQLRLF